MTNEGNTTDLTRLRDLTERSMRRAEKSLRSFVGHSVRLTVCGVDIVSAGTLSALADNTESGPMAGMQFEITGEAEGRILILFPLTMILRFLQALLGRPAETGSLTEMELSAIQEVGNIMASSFLSELGDLLARRLLHSVPEMRFENIPQWVRDVLIPLHALGSEVLVAQGLLEDGEQGVRGRFFVVSEVAVLESIVRGIVR